MTQYTSKGLPWPEVSDKIAKTTSPEDGIRQDFEALAKATDVAMVAMDAEILAAGGPTIAPSRTQVAAIGDSLVRGYTDSTAWDLTEAWPHLLSTILSGVEVAQLGFGGNTSSEIMARLPAVSFYFTPAGGTIPASGSVVVTSNQALGFVVWRSTSINGTLAGVYGTLLHETTGVMTFTRASTGVAATVSTPSRFVIDRGVDYRGWTAIGWFGRNDVTYDTKGPDVSTVEHVVAAHMQMDQWHRAQRKQYAVVSVTNRTDEPAGSANYLKVQEINTRLATLFPGRFIDIRSWLVKQAIYDAGLTPTSADLANMALDAPPPQIMDSGSHYTKPISPLIAARFAKFLKQKGWVM